jgi:hypothetical protein
MASTRPEINWSSGKLPLYTCSAHKCTSTVPSCDQSKYLVKKKNSNGREGNDKNDGIERGEIDDKYEFLEQSGNYYVSLLA